MRLREQSVWMALTRWAGVRALVASGGPPLDVQQQEVVVWGGGGRGDPSPEGRRLHTR